MCVCVRRGALVRVVYSMPFRSHSEPNLLAGLTCFVREYIVCVPFHSSCLRLPSQNAGVKLCLYMNACVFAREICLFSAPCPHVASIVFLDPTCSHLCMRACMHAIPQWPPFMRVRQAEAYMPRRTSNTHTTHNGPNTQHTPHTKQHTPHTTQHTGTPYHTPHIIVPHHAHGPHMHSQICVIHAPHMYPTP
jgi:hypothetical protein